MNSLVDHTLLKPDATEEQIRRLCDEAREFKFAAVCVNPFYVPLVHSLLQGSGVKTCSVICFPLGAVSTQEKAAAARTAISGGAQEVDMVMNIGALKDRRDGFVLADISAVAGICHAAGALLKVILETGLLTNEEKERACKLCIEASADFVKTSTGFGAGGATAEDVTLMSNIVKSAGLGVKASGGIRTPAAVQEMTAAGATRIGTSSGVAIMKEIQTANKH